MKPTNELLVEGRWLSNKRLTLCLHVYNYNVKTNFDKVQM